MKLFQIILIYFFSILLVLYPPDVQAGGGERDVFVKEGYRAIIVLQDVSELKKNLESDEFLKKLESYFEKTSHEKQISFFIKALGELRNKRILEDVREFRILVDFSGEHHAMVLKVDDVEKCREKAGDLACTEVENGKVIIRISKDAPSEQVLRKLDELQGGRDIFLFFPDKEIKKALAGFIDSLRYRAVMAREIISSIDEIRFTHEPQKEWNVLLVLDDKGKVGKFASFLRGYRDIISAILLGASEELEKTVSFSQNEGRGKMNFSEGVLSGGAPTGEDVEILEGLSKFMEESCIEALENSIVFRSPPLEKYEKLISTMSARTSIFDSESGRNERTPESVCVSNMKTIEGAVELFDMENAGKKIAPGHPVLEDLVDAGYLREKPVCPSGGSYAILKKEARFSNNGSIVRCSVHNTIFSSGKPLPADRSDENRGTGPCFIEDSNDSVENDLNEQ